ncbi:hypothetical protein GLOIN_2v1820840 [Rhizophagus irregularis DAOM 181602=DAOM 197198]|nr:hypothetical protein GLOIN_2v1820840 [Rhizophagus irregularis DAOM 181602=DAOM 197198]
MATSNRTCDRCGKTFATPQKLRGHQNRKFLCKSTANPQDPTPEIVQLQPQPEQFQDPTPEIVQLQPQPEQLQDPTPEVIPAHTEKTPNLTIDELAKWLAGPGDYNQYTPRKRRVPQTDNEWFAYMQGDYRGRWCDIQFVKRGHDPARPHKSLKHKTVWQADLKPNVRDIPYFPSIIADTRQKITEILERELEEKGQIKSAITILATYTDNSGTYKQVYHRGVMRVLLLKNDIDDHLTKSAVDITDKIVKFMKGGSGWKIVSIDILTIETYTYRRAKGGSYILTPKALANKKCTINPDNKDLIDPDTGLPSEKCLQGALGAYFAYKDGHTQKLERIFRAEKFKPYLEQVNLNAIPMPTPVCPRIFSKIEDLNPEISINVWEWEEKTGIPKPVIASKNYNRQHIIHLMALTDITKSDEGKERSIFAIELSYQLKANSFCYMVHWIETDETWGPFLYRGPNATEEFVSRLDKELRRINDVLEVKVERIVTEEAKKEFTKAVSCWICNGNFNQGVQDKKVWDHCHITGKFRGAAHNACNLKLQIEAWKTPIPVVFHNFRGYDSHLVCESVGRSIGAHQIKVIAETFERYKSMKVGQFKYIDSMQFMASSLANLAKNLGTDKPLTKRHFNNFSSEHIDLITRKGVYPYEYIDSHDRFKETELPSIHDFHSTLGGKITQDNYKHAQKVWKEFGCKNLGEYHDLYLKTDVLLLADVWTKFRQTAMHHYGLDPSHYVSAPALSWDGMLKMTGVKIELFTDMTMHDFTEKAKRGGIAMAGHRFLKANNPKMGDSFNPSKPTTWISYVDANNLYGWAMSQYLPIGNYRWEASPEYFKQNLDKQKQILNVILNTKPDAARGYFLNIKAHFPLKTHDYLQDLPPAVDSIAVKKDRLSPYITKLVDNLDGGRFPETEKLVPHLSKHEDYVIHYQELQYYIKLGMVVDEITQVLSFDQDNWLAPYIAKNTNLRQQSKNSFEKDFFKLMNNSVYGKTMENVRKYQDVKLMRMINENDEKKFLKKVRKPSFKYARQLGNTLVGAHMGKASVILNKPIIIGASILGLSKLLMYRFWYGFVKEKYGNKVRLGYMDTDSFIYHVETEDIYKDMAERPDLFDLNDTKTIGLFKDETPGNVITESYHIRAKSYHYVLADKSTKSKHKGVSKKGMSDMAKDTYFPSLGGTLLDDTVEKDEIFDPMTQVYRDCLFENGVFYAKNVGMRTKNHVISLIESEKKALSPIDTKRWIWSDGISSLPFGHWCIQVYKKLLERGTSHEAAEKIAIGTRLPEKY